VVRKSTGYPLQDAEEWWAFVCGQASWQKAFRQLPQASLGSLWREILQEVDGLRTSEGICFDASALIGIGVRA